MRLPLNARRCSHAFMLRGTWFDPRCENCLSWVIQPLGLDWRIFYILIVGLTLPEAFLWSNIHLSGKILRYHNVEWREIGNPRNFKVSTRGGLYILVADCYTPSARIDCLIFICKRPSHGRLQTAVSRYIYHSLTAACKQPSQGVRNACVISIQLLCTFLIAWASPFEHDSVVFPVWKNQVQALKRHSSNDNRAWPV